MKKTFLISFILLSLGIGVVLLMPFSQVDAALQCQNGTTTSYQQSWYGCFGPTDESSCGGFCSGGWCYEPAATPTYQTCPDNTTGSCSYSSTCDESGDITSTFYFCGSSTQGCVSSTSTESGACSRSTSGQSCGTNLVCSSGSCVTSCVPSQGQACNVNACGQAGGIIQCNGSCSGSTPATPYTLGQSCTSSPNACGATNGTIADSCSGTCTPPSNPSTCSNNVGETGYQCPSGCTAPPNKTLSVTVTANPSSGKAPLKNVQIDASVGGTATGTITYKLDCTNDLVYDATETSSSTSYTFIKKCDYDTAGTYTARVNVTRQTLGTSNTASVTVTTPTLTFPADRWQRLWYATSGASPTFNTSNFLGEGPNESVEKFNTDWGSGNPAHSRPNNIGFQSSRTIYFPFAYTYRFTVGADDGFRLSIDGVEKMSEWNDNNYAAHVRTVDVYLPEGNHTFQLDYYENAVNAKVSFGYELAPCNKASSVTPSTFLLEVPAATPTGKKNITATVSHWGADDDGSGVILERNSFVEEAGFLGNPLFGARVHLDDLGTGPGSTGDCDDDVVWDTLAFKDILGSTRFEIRRFAASFKGGHTLTYGYDIALTEAVFKETGSRTARASASVSGTGSGPVAFAADSSAPKITYEVVECITDNHCTTNSDANASKAYCNGGATRTTANFPLNTCIDSVAPTISVTNIKRTSPADQIQDLGIPSSSKWLKAGIYEISISVDSLGGSAIDATYRPVIIRSKGPDDAWDTADDRVYSTTRTTANKFNVWVGPASSSLNDCVDEKADRCRVEVLARDLAGNERLLLPYPTLNIDYTPPTAQ